MAWSSQALQTFFFFFFDRVYLGRFNQFVFQGGENFKEEPADTPTCVQTEAETQLRLCEVEPLRLAGPFGDATGTPGQRLSGDHRAPIR